MASIISCRCMGASQDGVAGAVGNRRVHQRHILGRDDQCCSGRSRARDRMLNITSSLVAPAWGCQEFRVWTGIMEGKESHYVTTQRTFDAE